MRKILFFIVLIFLSLVGKSQQRERLLLGLFWSERPQAIIVSVRGGAYTLIGDGNKKIPFGTNDMFHISTAGGKVKVKNLTTTFGSFNEVEIVEQNDTSSLNIKSGKPKLANRVYEDNFKITSTDNRLKILNDAELANYVSGVIQWEAGNNRSHEYYKVQAIITRTYALKNIHKYQSEGFNLCDRVDSQVYKGRTENKSILKAVKETKDLVLVDENMSLISAVFHSNSGGKTHNSEEVWSRKMPYLRTVEDTFSIGQPHYEWEKTLSINKWLNTFEHKFNIDVSDPEIRTYLLSYCPTERKNYFLPNDSLKTTTVRSKFGLRSTDFCVTKQGNNIIIKGKGFGHGVGLSQEGAMKMADKGISYEKILLYYYKNVHLVHLSTMDFLEAVD